MTSFIGWLDYSEAEQQQVNELIRFFEQPGTVDDLGIGTIRDAFSNRLFPGTSIIQTRARYFLFVPWIYNRCEEKHRSHLVAKADDMERKLIGALLANEDHDGLIGRVAGKDVRTLPSTIYWSGLGRYGIFLRPGLTKSQLGRQVVGGGELLDAESELSDRPRVNWQQELPPPPDGFFDFDYADFALTRDEAEWLSERVLSTEVTRGVNLLSCFVRDVRTSPVDLQGSFWVTDLPDGTTDEIRSLVHHAARFSASMHGAALLYNQMLAEARGADGDDALADLWADELTAWAEGAAALEVPRWSAETSAFWSCILVDGVNVSDSTRSFVEQWSDLLASTPLDQIGRLDAARQLVRNRELQHKRVQARFGNRTRLMDWNGNAGTAPLVFRWPQVQRFLADLSAGLHPEEHHAVD